MARLKQPPRRGVIHPVSPSSHASTDGEAATQQLLAESRASASKPAREHPQPSAVRGAHLLNAVRIDFRHSSPPLRMARRKASNGKLPRASLAAERPRQNLARERDVYELPESPQKSAFRLPETVNREPLTVLKKRRNLDEQHSDSHDASSDLPQHDDIAGPARRSPLRSSPLPATLQAPQALNVEEEPSAHLRSWSVDIEERLPSGALRCATVSYKNDRLHGPTYQQCHNAAAQSTGRHSHCSRHKQRPGSTRCQYVTDHDGHVVQCRAPATIGQARCARHSGRLSKVGDRASGRTTSVNSARKPGAENNHNAHDTKPSTGQVTASRDTMNAQRGDRNQMSAKHRHAGTRSVDRPQANRPQSAWTAEREPSIGGTRKRSAAQATASIDTASMGSKLTRRVRSKHLPQPSTAMPVEGSSKQQHSAKESPEQLRPTKSTEQSRSELETVFHFLRLDERTGSCQTDFGRNIKRICDTTCALLQEEGLAVENIWENIEHVQELLRRVPETDEIDHRSLKSDAYCYVFRSLVQVLQALHRRFTSGTCDPTRSLEALRLFVPLLRNIVTFKDTIAEWKVTISQRYKGDRIIKDVDSHLIAPLREVEQSLSRRLSQLESRERDRQKLADMQREQEEEHMEYLRHEEALLARQTRWRRWQELHIKRMQCEPPGSSRRKALIIAKLDDLEETDADGIKFERLPVFKDRVTPPQCRTSSMAHDMPWSAEQETALIDGLKDFAGPHVFESVFDKYCRPGGSLRDFSVTDITAKASWIRSGYEKLHQEIGWDLPAWVKQIPILP
ncbi:hypothetical protein FB567DRAFT_597466 [Paraphoma chrysanthemicola]|uniref:Uncharacterized protein n=1 Tax=Paraphoma chrysanthemicola TaxID=798071 RepID=A0A8K0VT90_9PLEO|nr:hypothetical protein FB567DRAFT_597466 [Paraphoma chrysanthemicola]